MKLWLLACVLALAAPLASAQDATKVLNPGTLKPKGILYSPFEKIDQQLVGAWAMTAQISGTTNALEYLVMDGEIYVGTNGTEYLVVERAFSTTGLGLVSYTSYGKWLLLLDTGVNYYRLYEYDAVHAETSGLYWLYPAGGSPTGGGSWMRGFRFADPADVVTARKPTDGAADSPAIELISASGVVPAAVESRAADMAHDLEMLRARR